MKRVRWKKEGSQTTFKFENRLSNTPKHMFTSMPGWRRRRKLFSNKTDKRYLRKRRCCQSSWHHQLRPLSSKDDSHLSCSEEGKLDTHSLPIFIENVYLLELAFSIELRILMKITVHLSFHTFTISLKCLHDYV